MLAPETAAEVQESAGKPCTEAILGEDLPEPGSVLGSDVYGQWAQVRLSGDTVFLAVFGDGWRVVAAGCTARGQRPHDCVIQETESVRFQFVLLLLVVAAGLVYFSMRDCT